MFDKTGVNKDFMRTYAPKVILLIGSSAINPSSSTEILGSAEEGIKVVLYKVNSIDPTDVEMLNEYYFETMHHEFAHILHQKKSYPTELTKYPQPTTLLPAGKTVRNCKHGNWDSLLPMQVCNHKRIS